MLLFTTCFSIDVTIITLNLGSLHYVIMRTNQVMQILNMKFKLCLAKLSGKFLLITVLALQKQSRTQHHCFTDMNSTEQYIISYLQDASQISIKILTLLNFFTISLDFINPHCIMTSCTFAWTRSSVKRPISTWDSAEEDFSLSKIL